MLYDQREGTGSGKSKMAACERPQNISVAVEISLLSCVHAKLLVFQVYRPPSWIFHFRFLPVWSYNILTTSIGQLDLENIGTCFEIVLLSCAQSELDLFQVYRPPSWIFHFCLHTCF